MHHTDTAKHHGFFKPMISSKSLQAAMMVLNPGQSSTDKPDNEHPKSEQWLLVISGKATAKVEKKSISLNAGSLLLIEHAEEHQIINTGTEPLVTINFYAPPAYTRTGDLKRR